MHVGLDKAEYGSFAELRPLSPRSVRIEDGLWKRKQAVNRSVSLRHIYQQLHDAGNFHNLELAAGNKSGTYVGKVFMDSDVYKWLEAVAYELSKESDSELSAFADEAIALIEAAQEPDGYIDSCFQVARPDERWTDLAHGHEMYCAGHLIEAAVAFKRLLNDDRLLRVAQRFADHIDGRFGPGKERAVPGHAEIELALVELYRETGENRYLDLARFLISERGQGVLDPGEHGGHGGPAVFQDHLAVDSAASVEGHAVRQLYLTTGVADVYLETGDRSLWDYLTRLWGDMTYTKTYVTGGVGTAHRNEAFSESYELPNSRAYAETCASIASMMWNWRMLLATGDSKYADSFETALYNSFLSGVSEEGNRFFYVNALLSRGSDPWLGRKRIQRMPWPWTPCCPPNVARFIALMDHYIATVRDNEVSIHQFIPSVIDVPSRTVGKLRLELVTDYPWQERVTVSVQEAGQASVAISLRIPAWCPNPACTVNGQEVAETRNPTGYLSVKRNWKKGDVVELRLPMRPTFCEAHPEVDSAGNSLSIRRGPIVYCLEQHDQEKDVDILSVQLDEHAPLSSEWETNLLGGVVSVTASGFALDRDAWRGRLYRDFGEGRVPDRRTVTLKAIPYFSWANRGPAAMRVWIPRGRAR